MIRVEELKKIFLRNNANFEAVQGVSLTIQKGEFAAITGHSGSGKTTLFNMIAGLIFPSSGNIYIDGVNFTALSKKEKAFFRNEKIGYILQSQNLLNNFTILDNICMPAYLSKEACCFKKRAVELLEKIGLADLANEYPPNLSGGEMRRISIARAMLNNPKVILADEPTSNLESRKCTYCYADVEGY